MFEAGGFKRKSGQTKGVKFRTHSDTRQYLTTVQFDKVRNKLSFISVLFSRNATISKSFFFNIYTICRKHILLLLLTEELLKSLFLFSNLFLDYFFQKLQKAYPTKELL